MLQRYWVEESRELYQVSVLGLEMPPLTRPNVACRCSGGAADIHALRILRGTEDANARGPGHISDRHDR